MSDLQQEFLAIARRIWRELTAIRESHQQQERTAHEQQQATEHQANPRPELRSILEALHGIAEQYRTASSDEKKYQRRNFGVQLSGVVVVALYTTAAFWQGREMRRAAKAAEDSVTQSKVNNEAAIAAQERIAQNGLAAAQQAAQKSFDATVNQFHLDQRAWLGPVDVKIVTFKEGSPVQFEVAISNSGKTPAMNVAIDISSAHGPNHVKFPPIFRERPGGDLVPYSRAVIQPGSKMRADSNPSNLPLSGIENYRTAKTLYYFFGRIRYTDVFNGKHLTTFCYFVDTNLSDLDPCDSFNSAD